MTVVPPLHELKAKSSDYEVHLNYATGSPNCPSDCFVLKQTEKQCVVIYSKYESEKCERQVKKIPEC